MRTSRLDLFRGIVLEFFEVFFEHGGDFLQGFFELLLVLPAVFGVEDLGVHALNILRVLQVENRKSIILSLCQFTAVDGIDDVASVIDGDSLS